MKPFTDEMRLSEESDRCCYEYEDDMNEAERPVSAIDLLPYTFTVPCTVGQYEPMM